MRRLFDPGRRLRRHFISPAAPDLVYAEVGNALIQYVRARELPFDGVAELLEDVFELGIDAHPLEGLAAPALVAADRFGLSVYDACYLVLAEQLDVPLVTADVGLARAASKAVLLP